MLAVFWYLAAQFIYVDQIFGMSFSSILISCCMISGSQFLLDISHDNIPNMFYYYVFYFLYAQVHSARKAHGDNNIPDIRNYSGQRQ